MSYPIRNEMQDLFSERRMPDVMKTLLLAYETIIFALRPSLKAAALTEPQWRVLHELLAKTPMIASELAANTFVRASSLSRILRDLEGRDLISRSQQFEDLRKTLVSITDYGRREIEVVETQYAEVLSRLESAVGREVIYACVDNCMALVGQCGEGAEVDNG